MSFARNVAFAFSAALLSLAAAGGAAAKGGTVATESLEIAHEGFRPAPAGAEGTNWTGWSEFYRSFAVDPKPTKLPGMHRNSDVTVKRGVVGDGQTIYRGARLQQGRVPLDDMPPLPPQGLAPKPNVTLPGAGTAFTGAYRINGATHTPPLNGGYTTTLRTRRNAGQ